jgi:hypothetical protein
MATLIRGDADGVILYGSSWFRPAPGLHRSTTVSGDAVKKGCVRADEVEKEGVSVLFCGVFDDFDYVSVIWLALQQK